MVAVSSLQSSLVTSEYKLSSLYPLGFYPLTWGKGLSGKSGASVIYGFGYDPVLGCGSKCHSDRGGSWWGALHLHPGGFIDGMEMFGRWLSRSMEGSGVVRCHQSVNKFESFTFMKKL